MKCFLIGTSVEIIEPNVVVSKESLNMLDKLKDFCQTTAYIIILIVSFLGLSVLGLLHGITSLINDTD